MLSRLACSPQNRIFSRLALAGAAYHVSKGDLLPKCVKVSHREGRRRCGPWSGRGRHGHQVLKAA
jgi:hypothetical protein